MNLSLNIPTIELMAACIRTNIFFFKLEVTGYIQRVLLLLYFACTLYNLMTCYSYYNEERRVGGKLIDK